MREFAHALESAVLLTANERIDVHDLPALLLESGQDAATQPATESPAGTSEASGAAPTPQPALVTDGPSLSTLDEVLKGAVLRTLDEAGGNRRRAAHLLGVSRSALYRMLTKCGCEKKFAVRSACDGHL